ncbi:MAG TPA: S9 family peptidase [Actinomycetota bacterium]|nr:S9 family peptidase [Actinomycetota bacterium]
MRTAPYGSWDSPITAAMVAESGSFPLSEPHLAGGTALWLEERPTESGRGVVARARPSADPEDVTQVGFNVRTKVHEYGGGAFAVHGDRVFFSNFADQRVYRQDGPGDEPRPITPESGGRIRFADGVVTPDGSLLICVRERHEDGDVVNELAAVPTGGSREPWTIAGGHDFFGAPRLSPDGLRLAWISWDHPRMPWDGTELWVAELRDGALGEARRVAGGPEESVVEPAWSPDGALHFVSDRTGWWNLYRERDGAVEALAPMDAEFSRPMWVFGESSYAFLGDGRIACTYGRDSTRRLALLDPGAGELLELDLLFTVCDYVCAEGDRLLFVAGSASTPMSVVSLDFTTREVEVLRESARVEFDAGYISEPRSIEFPTEGGLTAHALHYPPRNPDFVAPEGLLPPLIVMSHGGPTGEASPRFDLRKQFWTTRGFAVVDVNYGGSTGHGRGYRERLKGSWGIVDVADCINAALHLADAGEADPKRLAIRGGSAGGYTTLCALTFHDLFAAGTSYFGVADAAALARDTHKFESRYLDGLIGPYPEAAEVYRERSPIHFADKLSCPVLILQGLEDEVVPASQAEKMVGALKEKGLPYAYLAFEGEQHGFRMAENIRRCYEAELSFYAQVFGFELAGDVPWLEVANLPA